jgi:hypothetical protein
MKLRTEIEAAPQGGVVWQVHCEYGLISHGHAFDATAALEVADTVIRDWHRRFEIIHGSLAEFGGQALTEELVLKVTGKLNALAALFDELA